jgi:hypothetical protein
MGFVLVAKRNPDNGHLRIFARVDKRINLTKIYEEFYKKDPQASWYLHPSKTLLFNGMQADLDMVPTKLSLEEIIKVLSKA